MTDHERIEAAALGSSTRAIGGRAELVGGGVVYTETGAAAADGPGPSYRNILRAGFRESYLRPNWHSA